MKSSTDSEIGSVIKESWKEGRLGRRLFWFSLLVPGICFVLAVTLSAPSGRKESFATFNASLKKIRFSPRFFPLHRNKESLEALSDKERLCLNQLLDEEAPFEAFLSDHLSFFTLEEGDVCLDGLGRSSAYRESPKLAKLVGQRQEFFQALSKVYKGSMELETALRALGPFLEAVGGLFTLPLQREVELRATQRLYEAALLTPKVSQLFDRFNAGHLSEKELIGYFSRQRSALPPWILELRELEQLHTSLNQFLELLNQGMVLLRLQENSKGWSLVKACTDSCNDGLLAHRIQSWKVRVDAFETTALPESYQEILKSFQGKLLRGRAAYLSSEVYAYQTVLGRAWGTKSYRARIEEVLSSSFKDPEFSELLEELREQELREQDPLLLSFLPWYRGQLVFSRRAWHSFKNFMEPLEVFRVESEGFTEGAPISFTSLDGAIEGFIRMIREVESVQHTIPIDDDHCPYCSMLQTGVKKWFAVFSESEGLKDSETRARCFNHLKQRIAKELSVENATFLEERFGELEAAERELNQLIEGYRASALSLKQMFFRWKQSTFAFSPLVEAVGREQLVNRLIGKEFIETLLTQVVAGILAPEKAFQLWRSGLERLGEVGGVPGIGEYLKEVKETLQWAGSLRKALQNFSDWRLHAASEGGLSERIGLMQDWLVYPYLSSFTKRGALLYSAGASISDWVALYTLILRAFEESQRLHEGRVALMVPESFLASVERFQHCFGLAETLAKRLLIEREGVLSRHGVEKLRAYLARFKEQKEWQDAFLQSLPPGFFETFSEEEKRELWLKTLDDCSFFQK